LKETTKPYMYKRILETSRNGEKLKKGRSAKGGYEAYKEGRSLSQFTDWPRVGRI